VADTLHIDADRQICSLTWRGAVAVTDEALLAELVIAGTVAVDGGTIELPDCAPSPPTRADGSPPSEAERELVEDSGTMALSGTGRAAASTRAATPFAPSRGRAQPPPPSIASAQAPADVDPLLGKPRAARETPEADDGLTGTVGLSQSKKVRQETLPFRAKSATASPESAAPPSPIDAVGEPPPVVPPAPLPEVSAAEPLPAKAEPSLKGPSAMAEAAQAPALQLLWLDPTCLGRLRAHEQLSALLDAAAEREPDPAVESYARSSGVDSVDDFRDVLCVLSEAESRAAGELGTDVDEAIRDGNKLVPPLVVLRGKLTIALDERAELEATADIAAALSPEDEGVAQAVETARACLKTAAGGSVRVTLALAQRIRDAVLAAQDETDALALQYEIRRALIAGRCYRRRELFGGSYLVGQLALPGAAHPLAAYLRDTAASQLPMFDGFEARLLGEIYPAQEDQQPTAMAVRVVAVAREIPSAPPG